MRRAWTSALVTCAFACASSAAFATTYVAGAEFNGTQGGTTGVWTYGRLDGAGGTFTQGTINGAIFKTPGINNIGAWVGADFMHPGCAGPNAGSNQCAIDQAFANLRFTALSAGSYTATFQVKLTDPGNSPYPPVSNFDFRRDGVKMLLNSDFKYLETWDPNTASQSFTFQTLTKTVNLAAGQTIDFSVDHAGCRANVPSGAEFCSGTRYNLYDSTGFTATVESVAAVPEPASWAMMITGLGIAGATMRRRRVTAAVA
jgi:hypothetical protein